MPKNKKEITKKAQPTTPINETTLFRKISKIIEFRKTRAGVFANQEVTLMYWEIGRYIGTILLGGERSEYGKKILATLSQELKKKYGAGFEYTKLTRMIKFAELFPDIKIVSALSTHLSWSHFIEILPLETQEARLFYAQDAATRHLGIRELRRQISRKAYERQEIANTQLTEKSVVPFNVFVVIK